MITKHGIEHVKELMAAPNKSDDDMRLLVSWIPSLLHVIDIMRKHIERPVNMMDEIKPPPKSMRLSDSIGYYELLRQYHDAVVASAFLTRLDNGDADRIDNKTPF